MIPNQDTQSKYETAHHEHEQDLKQKHHHPHDERDEDAAKKRRPWWQFWRRG